MEKKIRILSLDGGGIRGIISCVILKFIEEQLQKLDNPNAKIGDYFDLIAGTSTGGILAAVLLVPNENKTAKFSVEAALDLYSEKGETIFDVNFWEHLTNPFGLFNEKISEKSLERQLNEVFGNLQIKDFIKPSLITSYDIFHRKAKFFTSHEAHSNLENFYAKDICRATSAAPTYFEPAKIKSVYGQEFTLIDGGVYANSPALCAFAEAGKIPFSTILNDPEKPDFPDIKDMMIVSVGTGEVKKAYTFRQFENAGKVKWIQPLIDILLSANAETTDYQLQKMYKKAGKATAKNYYRLMPNLKSASSEMDDVSAKNIQELIQAGLAFVDQNESELIEIARKLIQNK
ncbi:patatin [Flavobacterium sp. NST-5]|uniref:Patatin n=1 Tax=Flavobacterium ichthyis TaxID=2698827 RepID=A0ABW9ZCC0_9FLAO|nr:patatin-like phospholipase family protein [Flavobacterium ichthyis]NBL65735.1 patatin [Flavobacterium ichthyis]